MKARLYSGYAAVVLVSIVYQARAMDNIAKQEVVFDSLQDWQLAGLHTMFFDDELECLTDEKIDQLSAITNQVVFLSEVKKLKEKLPVLLEWQAARVHQTLSSREFASLSKNELFALRKITNKKFFTERMQELKEAFSGYLLQGLWPAAITHLDVVMRARNGLHAQIDRINLQKSNITKEKQDALKRQLQQLMGEPTPLIVSAVREGYETLLRCMFAFLKKQCIDGITRNALPALPKTKFDYEGHSMSLLHIAAAGGNDDVVKFLLSQGFDVNVRDDQDETPLHVAARKGNLTTVITLIEHGAPVDVYDQYGHTPLADAVDEGHYSVAQNLINNHAKFNMLTLQEQKLFKIPGQKHGLFTGFGSRLKRNNPGDIQNVTATAA